MKITPAHDFNDFEVGRRHHLPEISVLDQEGHLALIGNEDYLRGLPEGAGQLAEELHGVERFAARKRIVARLEDFGFLQRIEPNTHMVPHGDRSGVVIEPCDGSASQQWTVTPSGTIVGAASGLCLSVLGGSTANYATADIYTCNGSGSESWSQQPVA